MNFNKFDRLELTGAAMEGDLDTLRQLCATFPISASDLGDALYLAASQGKIKVMRFLMARCDVPASRALEVAAQSGRGNVISALLTTPHDSAHRTPAVVEAAIYLARKSKPATDTTAGDPLLNQLAPQADIQKAGCQLIDQQNLKALEWLVSYATPDARTAWVHYLHERCLPNLTTARTIDQRQATLVQLEKARGAGPTGRRLRS